MRGLPELTRTHRILIGVVIAGAVIIAGIGFAGSYSAVRALALRKGFGDFALVFPVGIDTGILVLLALDLLLTWIRIPFPLLRHTAWMLTAATIAFNGAAAWPDPLGVGMHAVIPVLFVITVEAARHAIGRIANITEGKDIDGVRFTRWLLSPVPTLKLWRRMRLWELRSYEQAVGMEQDRLIYEARLQAQYGRFWRRKAPVEAVLPLRLAKLGVPLAQTTPAGLVAAGIDIEWRPAPAEKIGSPHRLKPVIAARQVAYTAQDRRVLRREEVTARITQDGLPDEETPKCEEVVQVPAPEVGQDRRTGDASDESSFPGERPQVAPGGHGGSDRPDPLAEHRARVAEETAAKRMAIRERWEAAKAENPDLSKAAFGRMTHWTDREVYAALRAPRRTDPVPG
ncbi:DUF2637 domain-containing protein [Streptomyces virginiae]